jgi:hypothetical protein
VVHNLFFEAHRDPELTAQIARLLSGDLWVDDNALQTSLLAGRRVNPSIQQGADDEKL